MMSGALRATGQVPLQAAAPLPPELRHGRELLAQKRFAEARKVFAAYLAAHKGAVQAQLGIGDAELGLHQYEAAEMTYRAAVAQQPQLWEAHKNLVVVEAALGRWEEFDRERMVLRMARERGAPGISTHESDVIDSFVVAGEQWVVRAYFEPVGRSQTQFNFERFSQDGHVQAYVSLENAAAAQAALQPRDVRIGAKVGEGVANSKDGALALNWYTGRAHGTIRNYTTGEPSYPRLRTEVQRWLRAHPVLTGSGQKTDERAHFSATSRQKEQE